MKAYGNGMPAVCASNLLRIVRGEVPYDRVRGRNGAMVDQPDISADAAADAEWVLKTFEPRVRVKDIAAVMESALSGGLSIQVDIAGKEDGES